MCKTMICLIFAFALMTGGCSAAEAPLAGSVNPQGDHVSVYYFHGDFRCPNCHKIETYTKEAVEGYFGQELDSGKLVFKVVNVDRKENQHFIKDYQLYTKSVVVSLVKDGKEVKADNLQGVWNHLGDKQRFFDYIKSEVSKYLEELG